MIVEVVPYRETWPEEFEKEKSSLIKELGTAIVEIHHIGSTSVPGLWAKPIIDILLEAESLEALDNNSDKFENLGYDVKGEFGISGRRYYRKGGDTRTHQIHAFKINDDHVFRHLAFRDYIEAHPDILKEYQSLKIKIASECENDIEKYCDGKDEFVKFHEAKAIAWKIGSENNYL